MTQSPFCRRRRRSRSWSTAIAIPGARCAASAATTRIGRSTCPDDLAPCARKRPRTANWPHALGFSEQGTHDGLCIALGWEARHWRPGLDCFAAVHRTAEKTAAALITLVRAIVAADPRRQVDVLSHSLGARVVLQALRQAPDLPVARAILLGGAEYSAEARAALAAQDRAGGRTEFYHMIARANDLYDGLFQLFAPRTGASSATCRSARAGSARRTGAGSTCSSTIPRRAAG